MLSAADVLEEGADLIDRFGHCKGHYINVRGSRCVDGALLYVTRTDRHAYGAAVRALQNVISENIVRWNDLPTTTQADVTSAMRAAAGIVRARMATIAPVEAVTECV